MRILNKENWVFEFSWKPWVSICVVFEYAFGGWEFYFYIFGVGFFLRYNTRKADALFEKWDREAKEVE